MKKNAMLKIAAILMVAVLLTTCAISSTFAKYVTTGEGSDSARVAKWGITVDVEAEGAFADAYGDKVQAGVADQDLVAPGTKNDNAVSVTISSDMVEVDAAVVVTPGVDEDGDELSFVDLEGWTIGTGNTFYCPLVIKVDITGKETATFQQTEALNSAALLEGAINDYIAENFGADDFDIQAGAAFSKTLTIGWSWAYGDVTTEADGYVNGNDVNDTLLGNSAENHTIAFNVDVVVYQTGPAVQ